MTEDSADSSGPLVSVIVRAAGEGEGLARTLRSVLDQTWGRLLILVVEPRGGGARGLIDALDPPRPGRRIVLTDLEPDAGRGRATNAALQRAEGKYVAYLDAGDVFYRRHVERLAGALERSDRFGAAYGDHYRTYRRADGDAPGRVLSKVLADHARFDRLRLCRRDYIPQTCLLHRRDLLDRTGPCEESLAHLRRECPRLEVVWGDALELDWEPLWGEAPIDHRVIVIVVVSAGIGPGPRPLETRPERVPPVWIGIQTIMVEGPERRLMAEHKHVRQRVLCQHGIQPGLIGRVNDAMLYSRVQIQFSGSISSG